MIIRTILWTFLGLFGAGILYCLAVIIYSFVSAKRERDKLVAAQNDERERLISSQNLKEIAKIKDLEQKVLNQLKAAENSDVQAEYTSLEEEDLNNTFKLWLKIYYISLHLNALIKMCMEEQRTQKMELSREQLANKLAGYEDKRKQVEKAMNKAGYQFSRMHYVLKTEDLRTEFEKFYRVHNKENILDSFFSGVRHFIIKIDDDRYFVFLPCYFLMVNMSLARMEIKRYWELSLHIDSKSDYVSDTDPDDVIERIHWLYERVSGGPDLRYTNNPKRYSVRRGIVVLKAGDDSARISFSNPNKAIVYKENFEQFCNLLEERGYENQIYDALSICNFRKLTEDEKKFYNEMQACCTDQAEFVGDEDGDGGTFYFRGGGKNIVIPDLLPFKGEMRPVYEVKFCCKDEEMPQNVLIRAKSVFIDSRLMLFVKRLCFAPSVESCIIGSYSIKDRMTKLEQINFPSDGGVLLFYLIRQKDNGAPYFESLQPDMDGLKRIYGVPVSAERDVELYDSESSEIVNLQWTSPKTRCKKVVVRKDVRSIMLPDVLHGNVGEIVIENNSRYSVKDGILYERNIIAQWRILGFTETFVSNELVVAEDVCEIVGKIPETVKKIYFCGNTRLSDQIIGTTVREIVIEKKDMVLGLKCFADSTQSVTVYAEKSSVAQLETPNFMLKPLTESEDVKIRAEALKAQEERKRKELLLKKFVIDVKIRAEALKAQEERKREELLLKGFVIKEMTILKWEGSDRVLEIPEGIAKTIGAGAFQNSKRLQRVTIPEGIISIEEDAFRGAEALTQAYLPKSLKKIGRRAFYQCTSLTEISILSDHIKIEDHAYGACVSLQKVNGLKDLTWDILSAFSGTPWLKMQAVNDIIVSDGILRAYFGETVQYNVPGDIHEIGESAFEGNQIVEKIEIADGVTKISARAFAFCDKLKQIIIPESVTEIEDTAFFGTPKVVFYCYRGSIASKFRQDHKIGAQYIAKPKENVPLHKRASKAEDGFGGLSDDEKRIILEMRRERERQAREREQNVKVIETAQILEGVGNAPFDDCDDRHVLTNNIVQKHFIQKEDPKTKQYKLYFIDDSGNKISKIVTLIPKPAGEKYKVVFELQATEGFQKQKLYHLLICDQEDRIVGKIPYKIDIVFSNDFGF